LCGFDPIDLLARVDFPNDRFERLLRVSKLARQLALHREDIPLPDLGITAESETAPGGFEVPIASSHQRDDNLLVSLLEPTTKFSLDVKEGIKVEHIGSQDRNEEAIAEAKARDAEVLKEQLARSAAAITIQSFMRGFLVRRRVVDVVYAALTTKSHDTDAEKVTKELPSVVDLNVQERLIVKFGKYCKSFEQQQGFMPDFPQFAAAKIQASFRMFSFHKKWRAYYGMPPEEREGANGAEAKATIIRKAERAEYKATTYSNAIITIQNAWRRFSESKLIDSASGIHVRFRLGGTKFPPTIYYKIFIHDKLIDLNSFSPRDYTKQKQLHPKVRFNNTSDLPQEEDSTVESHDCGSFNHAAQFKTEEELLDAIANLEMELESDFLLKWSEALDFTAYSHDWLNLSTTGKSDGENSCIVVKSDEECSEMNVSTMKILSTPLNSKLTHHHAAVTYAPINSQNDDMMTEIELYRKIAGDVETGSSTEAGGRKPRPWSGKSVKSLGEMFLSEVRADDIL
ncbi:hypothetical protein HDU82_002653, partial [Entophlyctis luteolus]